MKVVSVGFWNLSSVMHLSVVSTLNGLGSSQSDDVRVAEEPLHLDLLANLADDVHGLDPRPAHDLHRHLVARPRVDALCKCVSI